MDYVYFTLEWLADDTIYLYNLQKAIGSSYLLFHAVSFGKLGYNVITPRIHCGAWGNFWIMAIWLDLVDREPADDRELTDCKYSCIDSIIVILLGLQ